MTFDDNDDDDDDEVVELETISCSS